ncbi:hypothetical protein [Arsenophonus sp. PmNCSU2021_1]
MPAVWQPECGRWDYATLTIKEGASFTLAGGQISMGTDNGGRSPE